MFLLFRCILEDLCHNLVGSQNRSKRWMIKLLIENKSAFNVSNLFKVKVL